MTTFELQKLDEALAALPATPKTDADLDARATLMARRIELDQAIRAASSEARLPKLRGNLTVNVPASVGLSHFYGSGGRVCQSRMNEDGRLVVDIFLHEFKSLLGGRRYGHDWHKANPEALLALGRP